MCHRRAAKSKFCEAIKVAGGALTGINLPRMKRLAWLLLAVFCTALAQVQPVELSLTKAGMHRVDCDCEGACGMPECVAVPVTAQQPAQLERAGGELRQITRRVVAKLRAPAPKFYLSFVEPVVVTATLRACALTAPAVSPPLFRVHCSFLL